MITNNHSEQISPDFKHRIDGGDLRKSLDLADTISAMACRAKGVLKVVSINLQSDARANDEFIDAAICSAIAEIEDINATIQAYHTVVSAMKTEAAGGAK